jgi:hypothetical protein
MVGPTEYNYYEALRDRFLRSARGRAAFLMGGIVWRLAFETLGTGAEQRVLSGPSGEILDTTLWIGEQEWCDDALTEAELDLICGVYKIGTGKCKSG